ncbi:kinase-like domain-containing protein [Favolaschia claudopus]|uniref:Kinase-like domain-containing protein n=1 Tax=Favolaschia claudopus TaxID=2862362 RepID=A0AAW0DQN6_9AGAR
MSTEAPDVETVVDDAKESEPQSIESSPQLTTGSTTSDSSQALATVDDATSTRKITIVEPEKPQKEVTESQEDDAAAIAVRSPSPDGEEVTITEELAEEGEGNDFEQDDEEDELEEAYFWHDQIIGELRRVCRDSDPRNAYKILDALSVDRLGRTSYTARAARTGEIVVVKSNVLEPPVERFTGKRLITELFLMRDMLSHPNVISFYDLYLVEESEVWLVTEYMSTGVSLGDIIAKTTSKFTEERIARICVEVCKGLSHLHSQLIMHRDMRSDSVIIDNKGRVKITGLAFSVQLPDKAAKRRTMVSTLTLPNRSPYTVDKTHWTSPEVIKRKEYGFEVDVWAWGITMVEMIDGAPPYAQEEPLKVLFLILVNGAPELKDPDSLTDELKDFLSDCLAVDVSQRATMGELLEHEFLKKACPAEDLVPLLEFKPEPEPEPGVGAETNEADSSDVTKPAVEPESSTFADSIENPPTDPQAEAAPDTSLAETKLPEADVEASKPPETTISHASLPAVEGSEAPNESPSEKDTGETTSTNTGGAITGESGEQSVAPTTTDISAAVPVKDDLPSTAS